MRNAKLISAAFVVGAAAAGVALKAMGAPPNVEGLMPFVLALGLVFGPVYGFVNGLLIRALYDGYLSWAGPWTVFTSLSYGVVGLLAGFAGRFKRNWGRLELTALAAGLTLVYDAVTMLAFGAMLGIPFAALVAGQVPFTLVHVAGNVVFVFLFAPVLAKAANKATQEELGFSRLLSFWRV